jgi:hypothetical protein
VQDWLKLQQWCNSDVAALGGLVVSVLATGPLGLAAAGSSLAEDGGFLWVIKNLSRAIPLEGK